MQLAGYDAWKTTAPPLPEVCEFCEQDLPCECSRAELEQVFAENGRLRREVERLRTCVARLEERLRLDGVPF